MKCGGRGQTGWVEGRAGAQADEGSGRTCGRADGGGHAGQMSEQGQTVGGRVDRLADGRTSKRADGGGRWTTDFQRVKILN